MKKITNKRQVTIFITILILAVITACIVSIPLAIYKDSKDKSQTPSEKKEKHGLLGTFLTGKGKKSKTYQEACRAEDFEAAWAYVDELEQQAMEQDEYSRYIQKNVNAYISARDFVFNAEMQYLLANGSSEASDRVLFLLNSLPIKGKRLEEGYEGLDARSTLVDGSSYNKDFAWYCESIRSYNDKCRQIMELCILRGNGYLAEKIVSLVKETPPSSGSEVHYTDHDKIVIKKMYEDAFNKGSFKQNIIGS